MSGKLAHNDYHNIGFIQVFLFTLPTSSAEAIQGYELTVEQRQYPMEGAIGGHVLQGQQQYPVVMEDAVGGAVLPPQPVYPMDGPVGGAHEQQVVEQFTNELSRTMVGENFSKL